MVRRTAIAVILAGLGWSAAAQQNSDPEKGEQLLNASCIACHDL